MRLTGNWNLFYFIVTVIVATNLSFRRLSLPTIATNNPFNRKEEMAKGASFRKFIIVDDSTIRETRDRQEEKRPRKRARVDSDDEEPANTKDSRTCGNGWPLNPCDKPGERDSQYYLDNDPTATCIFRVEDVLFKVSTTHSIRAV